MTNASVRRRHRKRSQALVRTRLRVAADERAKRHRMRLAAVDEQIRQNMQRHANERVRVLYNLF